MCLYSHTLIQPRGLTPISGISSERSGLGLSSNSSSGSALSGISTSLGRGIRGSSIDRGRGRSTRGGVYHPSSLGNYQRSGFLYEEDSRGIGSRSERTWTERNGTEADWNATANGSPSPRKEFSALRAGGPGESWRRSRVEDDGQLLNGGAAGNEGWRTSTTSSTNSMYKWRKFNLSIFILSCVVLFCFLEHYQPQRFSFRLSRKCVN